MTSISSPKEFVELRQHGVRFKANGFISLVFLSRESSEKKTAMSIPRKVGNAVVRNRVRRRMRSCISELGERMPSGSYLFSIYPEVVGLNYHQLLEMVELLVEKVVDKASHRDDVKSTKR